MFVEFKRILNQYRGRIIGWSIGLAVYSLLMVGVYRIISRLDFPVILESFPQEVGTFFGSSFTNITSPQGYLDFFFFHFMILLLGILAIGLGSKLLAKDGGEGTLDLVLFDPASRSTLFWGRVLGFIGMLVFILSLAWISWTLPSGAAGLDMSLLELTRPFLSLLIQLITFGTLALFLSLVFSSSRAARIITGLLLIGNYLLVGLANINQRLELLSRFTPLHFYQGGFAASGLNVDGLIIRFELILVFILLSWYFFLTRDRWVARRGGRKIKLLSGKDLPSFDVPFLNSIRQPAVFLAQRLFFGLLVLAFITYASFLGLDMARGVSFEKAAADGIIKTLDYASDALQGDLGETSSGSVSLLPKPVLEVVPDVLIRSLGLLGASLLFAAILGLLLGVLIAGRRSGITLLALLGSIAGVSIPSFFAALLLQIGVIKITQATGKTFLPIGGFGWDEHILLPMLVLAARPLAQITRVTYVTVEDVLKQDYVRTAFSKGLRSGYVSLVHIIRNAAVPILTTIGLSLRFSLSSLPIVEFFFGWQGLGYTLLQSISNRDDNLTIVLSLCLGVLFILVNLLLDASYLAIDPRLRGQTARILARRKTGLAEIGRRTVGKLKEILENKPWSRWIQKRAGSTPSPFKKIIEEREEEFSYYDSLQMGKDQLRIWLKGTLGNPALILGLLVVLALFLVMIFSPQLSPHSPYTTRGMSFVEGEFLVPPFEPGETHPWGTDPLGRDIMSLILTGAQQTFTLAIAVVVVRLVVGFLLGASAGWFSGSWLDRFVLGASETIAAFPALLLVMVLILGIGIRQGMMPFIIAMSFIGWGEIMQYVRSKVLEIKPQLFIESAFAVGANSSRIIWKHVLPNLIPGLISILSLEMGAVLMLLGELGFIGIFIGGGAFAELEIWGPPYHYSDVPEWGALLSNIRIYARSYPWTALYPAGAFFVAIIGFNFLGEGIRKLIETVGVAASRLLVNKYSIAIVGILAAAFFWFRGTTGSTAIFIPQAKTFDGNRAYAYTEILTDSRWEGRALGTEGLDESADYIAGVFQSQGLQPAGEDFSYFQTRPRSYQYLTEVPSFSILDSTYEVEYQRDFVEHVGRYRNLGDAQGEILFLGMGNLMRVGQWWENYPALDKLDFSGKIVAVLSDAEAAIIHDIPKAGVLVVTEDPVLMKQRTTLSARSPFFNPYGSTETIGQDTPILRISSEVANHLLEETGYQLDSLKFRMDDLRQDEFLIIPTGKSAEMSIQGEVVNDPRGDDEPSEDYVVRNVIGHLPGYKGDPRAQMDQQMIVVVAQYDSPPLTEGQPAPDAANNNASGVAVMLELIHTIQESGYQPNRTFLFVAYAGEGQEGGEWVFPDVSKFLQSKVGFATSYDVEAVIGIRGVGAGEGEAVLLSTQGSMRLVDLFESSARRLGITTTRSESQVDLSVLFDEDNSNMPASEAPSIGVYWDEWWETGGTTQDDLETIKTDKLQQVGEVLSLGLMVMGFELNY